MAIVTVDTLHRECQSLSATVGTQDFVPGFEVTILGMAVTQAAIGIRHTVVMATGHGTTPVTMTIMHHRWCHTEITTTSCLGITTCTIPVIGIATVTGKSIW